MLNWKLIRVVIFLGLISAFSVGCTHGTKGRGKYSGNDDGTGSSVAANSSAGTNAAGDDEDSVSNPDEPISAADAEIIKREGQTTTNDLDDTGRDLNEIPMEVNRNVLMWIDYFQGRGREHMERYLSRSTRYLPMMKDILKRQGMPEDLVYIALIESGFSPIAHSSANAVGYWQFIRGTGRRYGLQISPLVDERRDFVKATVAAADYFKGLYSIFGSWYLAIASYNVGENRVKNVVMKYHTRDFWQLAKDRKLPKETINYVPKFLAARLIAKDPEKYGFANVDYQPPLQFVEVDLPHAVDLRKMASGMGLDFVDLRDLNPAYKKGIVPEQNGHVSVRVPTGTQEVAMNAAKDAMIMDMRSVAVVQDDDDVTFYKVRRGDSIATIAKKFKTTAGRIRSLNRMNAKSRIVAGKRIKVPDTTLAGMVSQELQSSDRQPDSVGSRSGATRTKVGMSSKKSKRVLEGKKKSTQARFEDSDSIERQRLANGKSKQGRVHVVKNGDTLADIARRYDVSLHALTAQNRALKRGRLLVGMRLQVP